MGGFKLLAVPTFVNATLSFGTGKKARAVDAVATIHPRSLLSRSGHRIGGHPLARTCGRRTAVEGLPARPMSS